MSIRILRAIEGHPGELVLCTVLAVKGSAPRHAGSRMLVGAGGALHGSVGGGRGEARALTAAAERLDLGGALILEIDMQGLEVEGPDMVCGGSSRILVERLASRAPYLAALDELAEGRPVVLVKRLETGAAALMGGDGRWLEGRIEGAETETARRTLACGTPILAEASGLLYDPMLPEEQLLILGGGHVGTALAALAPGLGFRVTVGDDRPAFLDPSRFPAGVAVLGGAYADMVAGFPFSTTTSVVIVTRSHLSDLECVRAVLAQPYRYAGFMGSRRKTRLVLEQAGKEFDPAKVAALCAPIGLEIGAETPEELAVAIAAELIAARRASPALAETHRARQARRQGP
jgi:xanthine dehydrogenase accessory factor